MKKKYWILYYTGNHLASDGLLSAFNCKTVVILTCVTELTTSIIAKGSYIALINLNIHIFTWLVRLLTLSLSLLREIEKIMKKFRY